jgi:hypothetical protein
MLSSKIEFITEEDHWGIIPEPYPAQQYLPKWYKALPHYAGEQRHADGTVKRCVPFLEAFSQGFIIPLAGDVEIVMSDNGKTVTTSSAFYDKIIGIHPEFQLGPNTPFKSPALKFSNFWAIKVPKGWSVLFVPPLNRPHATFECFSGVVECDRYFNYINFPFFMKDLRFRGIIPQGTPIIQAIPFKRVSATLKCRLGKLADISQLRLITKKLLAHGSYYRNILWSKRDKS